LALLIPTSLAACPANCWVINGSEPACSEQAWWEYDHYNPRVMVAYDLCINGLLTLGLWGPAEVNCALTVQDDWEVVGPPQGTAVDLIAQFPLYLGSNAGEGHLSGVRGMVREVGGSVDSVSAWAADRWAYTLSVPVHATVGESFHLIHELGLMGTGAYQQLGFGGRMYFIGLPPGSTLLACQGCDLVPTRQSTWGHLKATYR
jgi:hypothetical protein